MTRDLRIPGFLGRILDLDGAAVGTCFQVAPRIVVTACHVLADLGCDRIGARVASDALNGSAAPAQAEVVAVDAARDLAALRRAAPLRGTVAGLAHTDTVTLLTDVVVTGVSAVDDPGHDYRHLDATGTWQGGTVRDTHVALGRLASSSVVPGMSGAPVLRLSDNLVVGVVSARYNSADGWLRDSVWVARIEDLAQLLATIPGVAVGPRLVLADEVTSVLSVRAVDSARPLHSARPPGASVPLVIPLPAADASRLPEEPLALGGPREAALEAAKVLTALDDSCRGLGALDEVVESLLAQAAHDGIHSEEAVRDFRARIRARGLDPRVLLPRMAQHDEAVRRWAQPLSGGTDRPDGSAASSRLLTSLVRVLVDEVSGELFADMSEACRRLLHEGLTDGRTIPLSGFLNAVAAHLPPLRSTSVEAVLAHPVGHSGSGASSTSSASATFSASAASTSSAAAPPGGGAMGYRQLGLTAVAVQMCRLPDPEPCLAGHTDLVATVVGAIDRRMSRHQAATAFLSGQPGVGTSTVAIEAARLLIPAFPGGVFHVDLHGLVPGARRDVRTVVRIVSEALSLDLGSETMDDISLIAAFTAQLHDRQVLLVLDNALDAAHVALLVKAPTTCGIIVTSRDRVQSYAHPGLVFRVEPLVRDASVRVLALCDEGRAHETGLLHRLAYLCGDVPLALRMLGARMTSRPDLTLDYLVQVMEEETTRLDYLDAGDRAVRAAIKLSYDNLDEAARRAFRLVTAAPGSAVTGGELGHCLSTSPLRQELLLNRLVDRSLAQSEIVRSFTGILLATFTLFDLVRLFAGERLAEEEPESTVRDFRFRSVTYLRDRLIEITDQAGEAQLSGELDPTRFHAAERLAEEEQWLDLATDLVVALHVLYTSRGELDGIVAINETRIELHLRHGQPEEAVKACLVNADALRGKAGPLAVESARRAARIARDHGLIARVAEADFKLSVLQWEQGEFIAALEAGERAASTLTAIGQEAAAVPIANNNCLLARTANDAAKAVRWGRMATELAERWGNTDAQASAALERGLAERMAGKRLDAIALSRQAATLYAADEHWWNAAVACENGACAAEDIGDTATVVELRSLAADHWERRGSLPYLLKSLIGLSVIHIAAASYEQAQLVLTRAARAVRDPDPDPSSVSPLLRAEVLLRRAAIQLFLDSAPAHPDDDQPPPPVPSGTDSGTGTGAEEETDPELERVRDALQRHRAGTLTNAEARKQTYALLTGSIRFPPDPLPPWLYEELGKEPPPRTALGSG
ncbi:trypsin-like peptidase domain-containing protein [Streptomyces sp. H10-C2]|uniref:trypsin-like peptidase domain-containing protein n=1 Tax=unclassified Streptomyces TaxID=2593676 RepID=UPI0024B927D1|nr:MULTISPECIES: trypsin-like peptidase domain-containing protein [unclassified Streptomyces]MDJ0346186.1 trypsin-like peptidase domain-containing protein [Streptomyces sp. PH10-H1]MDJ0371137.1 trypsin-like peptidase domain-containing protein [Streptomyces sp. H10-C2]